MRWKLILLTGAQLTQCFSNAFFDFMATVNLHIISVIKKSIYQLLFVIAHKQFALLVAQWNSECFKLIIELEVIQQWLLKPRSLN